MAVKKQKKPLDQVLKDAMAAPRNEYRARALAYLREDLDALNAELVAHGFDLNKVAPYPSGNVRPAVYHTAVRKREFATSFYKTVGSPAFHGVYTVTRRDDSDQVINEMADKQTETYFDGFILKLSGKIGKPVKSAVLIGSLWNDCTLTVVCADDENQTWHTHCIFNKSCLGKVFNQWPTRRA